MKTRFIASTGEAIPVIGCGTWLGFDHAPGSPGFGKLPGVLDALFTDGGKVVDSSPMYGKSEAAIGKLLQAHKPPYGAFIATKVWTNGREAGIRQMEESMRRLRVASVDLMQVHNLVDYRTHLPTLRAWKDAGRVRYLGITHYTSSAYDEVEAILRTEKLDFLQINYSIDDRGAAQRLLPLASERGVAVLVNMPFGGGDLLLRLRKKALPGWAGEIGCTSWSQILLKFVLSHAAVTCVIPGSSNAAHMAENTEAGMAEPVPEGFWRDKLSLIDD